MVAIEFAASCRPLRKSNSSAMKISAASRGRLTVTASNARASDVLGDDAVDLVGDVVEAVGDLLQVIQDLHRDPEIHRLGPGPLLEQPLAGGVVDIVGLALD